MSPKSALKAFPVGLTDYEKGEILDYKEVYFVGKKGTDKTRGTPNKGQNFGYDDDKGDYKIVNGDHIAFRYEVQDFLGKGSFGIAVKCWDHKDKCSVAVKVIKNKEKYRYQAGVELNILMFLKDHDPDDIMNVIHMNDYSVFRKHLCITFECLSMNLFEFLKVNDFNGFDHNLIRRFAIQLLYALKYLSEFEIIHCDLKPENILLKEANKSGIKIIDFGSSTFMDKRVYTYI
jgi:dual specificity tyrosine-phosphorylation-regulated kinase 2/3/4